MAILGRPEQLYKEPVSQHLLQLQWNCACKCPIHLLSNDLVHFVWHVICTGLPLVLLSYFINGMALKMFHGTVPMPNRYGWFPSTWRPSTNGCHSTLWCFQLSLQVYIDRACWFNILQKNVIFSKKELPSLCFVHRLKRLCSFLVS